MNQQNNSSRTNVTLNTTTGTYYSQTHRLRIGIWNDRFFCELSPRTVNNGGGQNFSSDNSTRITMTRSEALAVIESIKAMKEAHLPSVLVPLGFGDTKKLLEIGQDSTFTSYIKLFINKLATGEVDTTRFVEFKFVKHSYNDGIKDVECDSEYEDFIARVKEFTDHSGVDYHAGKYSEMIKSYYSKGSGNNNYRNNSYGNNYNNNYNNNYGTTDVQYKGNNLDFIPNDNDDPNALPF